MKTIKTKVEYEFEFDAEGLLEEHVDVKGLAKDETLKALEDAIVNKGLTAEDVKIVAIVDDDECITNCQDEEIQLNWNQGHYDECHSCMCNRCATVLQCGKCKNCSGDDIGDDSPYAHHTPACNEFEQPIIMPKAIKLSGSGIDPIIMDARARSISRMCKEIGIDEYETVLGKIQEDAKKAYAGQTEMNRYQLDRQDEIENAVYNMLKVLTCDAGEEWNMEIIGDIADMICDELVEKGYLIYYPSMIHHKDDKITISDFHGI